MLKCIRLNRGKWGKGKDINALLMHVTHINSLVDYIDECTFTHANAPTKSASRPLTKSSTGHYIPFPLENPSP